VAPRPRSSPLHDGILASVDYRDDGVYGGLVASLVAFLTRVAVAIALALVLAVLVALTRDDDSFTESFRVAVWIVGCLMLLVAGVGHSPGMSTGSIDPSVASHFPKLMPFMAQRPPGTRVSPTALSLLTALTLFAVGFALG
jgi:hypothetical protein